MSRSSLTVSEVARISGVSIRTLHHYEEIGLFLPADRSAAGYRLYRRADLERLQQILFYRELGFPLEQIRKVLSDPAFDRTSALREQRALVAEKIAHFQRILGAVDSALAAATEKEHSMNPTKSPATDAELFDVFGHDVREHEAEAQQRWGQTDAYKESARRTSAYTKADWQSIKDEANAITLDAADAMARGLAPTDDAVLQIAERHRLHIERWFYPCPPAMHGSLGQMYVADPRFAATYDDVRPGLAVYISEAWQANAARAKP